MAQLHLAFASPIAAIKRQDERKFSDGLRKFDDLTVLIRQLEVGKALADLQVHIRTSLVDWNFSVLENQG
jgi:hypothetical protein